MTALIFWITVLSIFVIYLLIIDVRCKMKKGKDEIAEKENAPVQNSLCDTTRTGNDTSTNPITDEMNAEKDTDIKSLLMTSLKVLGCHPEEKDERIKFIYQGENFIALVNKSFIRIWDCPFGNIDILDTNMPLMLEAINTANFEFGPTVVLSDPDEKGMRLLHSKMDFIYGSFIPKHLDYLKAILNSFFEVKYTAILEYKKLIDPQSGNNGSILSSSAPSQN